MIELRNINFRYAGGTDAGGLVNIDLIIPDGQVILLCGQSGCGKTTLTRLVNGLIPNYYEGELSGEVLLDGKNISRLPLYETAKYVGSVFQNPRTQFFTVDSTSELAFGCENQGLPEEEIIQRVKSTAEQFDMDNLLGKNIFSLSGGEKQKIACASVSASNPPIIVLDEPSSNLDMSATKDLRRMIRIWKQQGKTVIIAEHRLYYLKELIDRVVYLKDGRIEKDYSALDALMNEPAIFYSVKGLNKALDKAASLKGQNLDLSKFFELKDTFAGLSNSPEDYSSIYHTVDGKQVCHDQVHNIYGANMTKAAGEYFAEEFGKEKILMFSRASYVGAHRSSGIWFGDNHSWWSHILLDLKMLPSANMCGFLYCGADLGGFNENATRDLVLRFLALGVFTPLMRNHAALGTRNQECYSFENSDDFKDIVEVRYRLIPYLYRTFKKASEENDMIFRPLSFDYPDDKIARECETQLMLGDECMICPVYEQNVGGRYVYLPENMTFVKLSGTSVTTEKMSKGTHYIEVALNEVPLFIKDGRQIELCKPAMRTSQLDTTDTVMIP